MEEQTTGGGLGQTEKATAVEKEATETFGDFSDTTDIKAAVKAPKKKIKLHERNAENDIRYRGVLSYRHLRITGWVLLAFAQLGTIIAIGSFFDREAAADLSGLTSFTETAGTLALSLFLFANFAYILNVKNGFKRLLLLYGGVALAIYIGSVAAFERYVVGLIGALAKNDDLARNVITTFFSMSGSGFFAYNIFIDLFLCALLNFFLNYRPKKLFKGKKLVVFRLFALIPIFYEALSIALKIATGTGRIALPLYVFPLLTTKPPMAFFMFIVMTTFIKSREWIYLSRGRTRLQYVDFLKTNVNSLHFSIVTSITILVRSVIDFALFVAIAAGILSGYEQPVLPETVARVSKLVKSLGFGATVPHVLLIPVIMLFSYTKYYDNRRIDAFIPIMGIGLTILVYIEGVYQLIIEMIGS